MKKRITALITALAAFALFAFCGCNTASKSGGGELKFGVKYISRSAVNKDIENYYIFNSDGTGEYRLREKGSYYDGADYNYDYTIRFVYTYADDGKEGIYCFYDGVEYAEGSNTSSQAVSSWSRTFAVSDNVIMASSGDLFINEDYAKKYLTNYNK